MLFKINGPALECESESGNIYSLTKTSCNCTGYKFRGTCKHFKEAWVSGWMKKFNDLQNGEHKFPIFSSSEYIRNIRRNALKVFLTRHKIKFNEDFIIKMEPKINTSYTAKSFIQLIKKELLK